MPVRINETKNKGRINRNKEIPDDLIATSSKLSPSFPNVIIDESNMAIGSARVTKVALAYTRNFKSVTMSRPLPTRSSIYFHNICIMNTNNVMKNVAIKGHKKAFKISLSSFLNMQLSQSLSYILTSLL